MSTVSPFPSHKGIETPPADAYNIMDYGAHADGETTDSDHLAACLTAANAAGKDVLMPAGTYYLATGVSLLDDVVVWGTGVGSTIITAPAKESWVTLLSADDIGGSGVRSLEFVLPTTESYLMAMNFIQCADMVVDRVKVTGGGYGLKVDTATGSNLIVRHLTCLDVSQPMYISNLDGGTFQHLYLDSNPAAINGFTSQHALYLERNNHELAFSDVTLLRGVGYSLQLYHDGGGAAETNGVSFVGLVLENCTEGIVFQGAYDDITIVTLTAEVVGAVSGNPVFKFSDAGSVYPSNVLIDGFTASGNFDLIEGEATGSEVRNGVYDCDGLGSATGVAVTNVVPA